MQPVNPLNPRSHRRTQHQSMQPQRIHPHQPAPVPPPPAPKKKKRRFSLVKTLLMLIGLGTVLVVLARYVIVPVLVMLPQWLGGVA